MATARHAVLCLVLMAVAAFIFFTPMQSDDSFGEELDIYTVSGDIDGEYGCLEAAFDAVNEDIYGKEYIITVAEHDPEICSFILNAGKTVTLRSSEGNTCILKAATGERHGVVFGNLTLENIILDGNKNSGGIVVKTNASLTMDNGAKIQNCYFKGNGGAVSSEGAFTMNSGSALINNKVSGDGRSQSLGTEPAGCGGAVYIKNGTFALNGGSISGNEAACGAGVYNDNSNFTMEGGVISGNLGKAPSSKGYHQGGGVGVYNVNNSTFTMRGGEITDNKLEYTISQDDNGGGGVYNNKSTFTMESGLISKNDAYRGGGVNNFILSVFTMGEGAVVSNNTSFYGGGVYNSGEFTIGSGAKVSENESVYVYPPGGGNGGGVYNVGLLVLQDGGKISNNKAFGYGAGVYSHGETYVAGLKGVSTITMTGGEISGNLSTNGGGAGVAVIWGGKFDMSGGKIYKNTAAQEGGGMYNYFRSEFTMTGGKISDNTADAGGGMYNNEYAYFTMTGGEISGNKATSTGGGVYNYYYSEFTMTGGEISGNKATSAGGVINVSNAVFTMTGGEISGNNAVDGAGVYNFYSSAKFIMTGGEISGNKATNAGGGVINVSNGVFSLSGGEIKGNTAKFGGGVYNDNTFTMSTDAAVSNNTADYGGGVYNVGTFNVTGGSFIGNTANGPDTKSTIGTGGGIYTTNFAKLTVANGVIFSGNTALTLRTEDITGTADADNNKTPDLTDYNNIGAVVLSGPASYPIGKNAPAYNNYDINYPGDSKAVYVVITPGGSGTVTVTYDSGKGIENKVFTADGSIVVPNAVVSIDLSAVPEDGYNFVQFTINGGPGINDDSTEIQISGNTTIVAEFSAIPVLPDDHIITASSDGGSTITPTGDAEVPHGEDKKFTFSPKKGYRITAVLVDGNAISSIELASGEYTFLNVESNHTIHVESKADNGNGGTGPGGNGGTNPGGNDTGPGGDEGTDPGNDGTGAEGDDGVSAGSGKWAVLNLVCAVIALFSGIVAIIAGRNRRRKEKNEDGTERNAGTDEDEGERSKTALILRVLALIVGIAAMVMFFLTEDWKLPVVPMDGWTPLVFVLLLVTVILTMASFGFDKAPEKDAEDESDNSQGSG